MTRAIIARHRLTDDHHRLAVLGWEQIRESHRPAFTTSLVFAEAITALARCTNYEFAAELAQAMLESPAIRILRDESEDDAEAARLMQKFADQRIGFVDCVSFAVMRRSGLNFVFGFDRHFVTAGFKLWPGVKRAS